MNEEIKEVQEVTEEQPKAVEVDPDSFKRLPGESFGHCLWRNVKDILIPVTVVFVLFYFIFNIFWVPTGSMETTLTTKSVLLGWRLPYYFGDPEPERGTIITFQSDELGEVLVKRCIGVGGDTISFKGGFVYVNGEKQEEEYVLSPGTTDCDKTFTVPEDCFFVLGDNRTGSLDARYWTQPYLNKNTIRARVFLCISLGKNHAWQGIHWVA